MPKVIDLDLYNKVKDEADRLYKKSSAYKSGWIVKKYKELGGEYADDNQPQNLKRWFKEEWADVGNKEYPVYRPTKRINEKTPLTIDEIDPSQLKEQIKLKQVIKGDANLPPFKIKGGKLEKKTINDYSDDVKHVFDKLTINGHYTVIGSASLKKIKYNSDYDLQELIKEKRGRTPLDKLYHLFLDKFIDAKKDENYFITDFKCGLNTNGEPLRWDYSDMKKGYKILDDGRKMKFQDCILIKSMMKLDMIVLIDGIFTEFSENYYINIGSNANYFEHEMTPEHIEMGIKKSLDEYLNVDKNYWKSLKRIFSLLLRDESTHKKLINELIKFFNGQTGLINKCKNELDIILTVIDNKFRKPKISDIVYNLEMIAVWASHANLKLDRKINKILKKKTLSGLYKQIEGLRDELYDLVNKSSNNFFKKKIYLN